MTPALKLTLPLANHLSIFFQFIGFAPTNHSCAKQDAFHCSKSVKEGKLGLKLFTDLAYFQSK